MATRWRTRRRWRRTKATTKPYDRTRERLTREEVERIRLIGHHTVFRFTEGPEVTVELVNPAADLPPIGVSEARGGPTVAAIGNAVAHALGTRLPGSPAPRADDGVAAENMPRPGLSKESPGHTSRRELRR
jgi:hypothetical protein